MRWTEIMCCGGGAYADAEGVCIYTNVRQVSSYWFTWHIRWSFYKWDDANGKKERYIWYGTFCVNRAILNNVYIYYFYAKDMR